MKQGVNPIITMKVHLMEYRKGKLDSAEFFHTKKQAESELRARKMNLTVHNRVRLQIGWRIEPTRVKTELNTN